MSAPHDADTGPLDPQIHGPESLAEMVKAEIERAEREKCEQRKQRDRRHEERTEASERNGEAMEAQRKADTDYAQRRVEEARARATEVAPPVSDRTIKRQRKATTSEPAGPTFTTATTLDELTQAAVVEGVRLAPPPWRELIRWWRNQDDLNQALTTAMQEALREALGRNALMLPWAEADAVVAEDLRAIVPGAGGPVDMMEYNRRWLALPEPRPSHVVSILVDAWLRDQPIDRDHRRTGILPESWRDGRHYDYLPLKTHPYPEPPGSMAGDQHLLPLAELQQSVIVPVLPLAMYDSGTGPMATRGRGAPYAQRLFVEILLDVGRLDRVPGQTARVEVTLRELVTWLWPNGWKRTRSAGRLGDLQILQRELLILDSMRILWERMLWRLVAVQALPTENSRMEDVIVFRVEHLPGSEHGPLLDRDRLRRFGTVSAPAWRAYLRLAYLWDAVKGKNNGARIYATRPVVARDRRGVPVGANGKPLRDQRGAVVKDWSDPRAVILGANGKPVSASNPPAYERNPAADRVPMLGPDDLILLAFDDSEVTRGTFRKRLHDARQALATMAATGAVILESDHYGGVRVLEHRMGHAVTLNGTRGNAEWDTR